jgi:hypothetical protein
VKKRGKTEGESTDALVEAVVEDARSIEGSDQEFSKKGSVSWRTYLLYPRGMGYGQAGICKSAGQP